MSCPHRRAYGDTSHISQKRETLSAVNADGAAIRTRVLETRWGIVCFWGLPLKTTHLWF